MRLPTLLLALALTACGAPASAQPSVREEGPATLRDSRQFTVHSALLNRDFRIYVAPPRRPEPGAKVAVVYALDGDSSFGLVADVARRLQQGGEMATAYVVSVGYGAGANRRNHDYIHERLDNVPTSGGGADFERFLLQELRPLIEGRYAVDPARSYLIGHSFGGLFVANVLVRRPDAFAGYLVSSGSLWVQDEAVVKAAARLAKAGRGGGRKVFMSVGQLEGDGMIGPILRFGDALNDKASGFSVSGQVWDSESHASVTAGAYARGLRMIMPAGDDARANIEPD
ncbi:MAG TPA: alpha/beta hydrolase-fold protein [Caulobacteraceae bacterium]|jgi:predicted alpha/beta superfamily hydrolase|nr:alpha/beta hydrolase-fold protein [Caulobacteraceae bacterium]